MKLSLKLNMHNSRSIRHQVHITDITLNNLKKTDNKYFLIVKRENARQKVFIRMLVDKTFIWNKNNVKTDSCSIIFNDKKLNVFIEKFYPFNKITRKKDMYCIAYAPKDADRLLFEVKIYIKEAHYKNKILPLIADVRKNSKPKNKFFETKASSPEEIRRKDFYEADKYAFHYSQNSDGNRSKREVFGGNFLNMSRSGKKL